MTEKLPKMRTPRCIYLITTLNKFYELQKNYQKSRLCRLHSTHASTLKPPRKSRVKMREKIQFKPLPKSVYHRNVTKMYPRRLHTAPSNKSFKNASGIPKTKRASPITVRTCIYFQPTKKNLDK